MSPLEQRLREWHRLFGLLLFDFFRGTRFSVELEKDLSLQQQFLDVVILRKRKGRPAERLPDGFDDLARHNLITFKSHQEALDDWALKELTGHYVNYRKQVSPKQRLLPESDFRLYAVCSRYPHNLANEVPWERLQEGVYHCRRGTDAIRVVVAGQLPQTEHNAMLHLFSASAGQVEYGARHYRRQSDETSTLLNTLFERYAGEGLIMPYTMEDFRRDYILKHFNNLTIDELQKALEGLSEEARRQVLEGMSAEDRLQGLSPEDRLAGLSVEEIERILHERQTHPLPDPKKSRRRK
jgi:hypothetical protein